VFALLMQGCSWCPSCGGDRYWGDFYSDPPDCWDPCDKYGNYTGGGCSTCGGKGRHARYSEYGGDDQGAVMEGDEGVVTSDNIVPQSDRASNQVPTPAKQPRKAAKP
jgi:hypothetical protein